MKEFFFRFIAWLPRISALLIVFVLSLFATESLYSHGPLSGRIFELCLQLCPALLVFILVAFTWSYHGYGAYLFSLLGIVFLVYFEQKTMIDFLLISGPLFLTAIFYLVSKITEQRRINLLEDKNPIKK